MKNVLLQHLKKCGFGHKLNTILGNKTQFNDLKN